MFNMRLYEWNNKIIGDYDLFAVLDKREVQSLVQLFHTNAAISSSLDGEEFYYFLNSENQTITPMPMLSLAFGGQYNSNLPYGCEITDIELDISSFLLCFWDEQNMD